MPESPGKDGILGEMKFLYKQYTYYMKFKKFLKEEEDVQKTISRLPKSHQELVKDYEIRFEPNNTLNGDSNHVGYITNKGKKRIVLSSPWRFGREFTLLHEISHMVWLNYVKGTDLETKWKELVKNPPLKKSQWRG